jgi:hypothetical protein
MPDTLPQDGLSLVPLLEGNTKGWPDRMIFTHQNQLGDTRMTPGSVRTQQYRLVDRGEGYELYDMVADPGQKTDIADQYPDVTKRLSAAYEAWYRDVTSRGTDAPLLPVGHPEGEIVALQAEDSKFEGGLQFRRKQGWAHDSVLNWGSRDDCVVWNIDVLQSGRYEISLLIGCGVADVGDRVRIEAGGQSIEAQVSEAHDPVPTISRAHDRAAVWTSGPVPTMTWIPLAFEPIRLEQGPAQLVVRGMDLSTNSRLNSRRHACGVLRNPDSQTGKSTIYLMRI